jgi:hypothetical protein
MPERLSGSMSEVCQICSRDGLDAETSRALSNGFRHNECPRLAEGDYHPFEHHQFDIGDVFYRDSDHTYFTEVSPKYQGRGAAKGIVGYTGVQAAEIPSPSGIAKYADPSAEALMGFAARVDAGRLTDHERRILADVGSGAIEVNTAQPRYLILRDAKGVIGTIAHTAAEDALAGKPTSLTDKPPSAQGYILAVDRFFNDNTDLAVLASEQVVYSAAHRYAGRFDAQVKAPLRRHTGEIIDHEKWLLDFKTSGFIGRAYHEQLHGYDLAAEECGVGAADRIFIVQLLNAPNEKGDQYILWPARASRQAFLNSLAKYHDGKATDKQTRADWRELVAA